jgi:hypothetical protein
MQQTLSLDTIGDLADGTARAIIDKAISEAVADLDDRGDDGKPRKIKIEVELKQMDNGLTESAVQACAVVPARRTPSTVAKVKKTRDKAQLTFQDMASDDPNQTTIDQHMQE